MAQHPIKLQDVPVNDGCQDEAGRAPVVEWLTALRREDRKAYAKCVTRIRRLAEAGYTSSTVVAGGAGPHTAWRCAFHRPDVANIEPWVAELVSRRTGSAVTGINRPARRE